MDDDGVFDLQKNLIHSKHFRILKMHEAVEMSIYSRLVDLNCLPIFFTVFFFFSLYTYLRRKKSYFNIHSFRAIRPSRKIQMCENVFIYANKVHDQTIN